MRMNTMTKDEGSDCGASAAVGLMAGIGAAGGIDGSLRVLCAGGGAMMAAAAFACACALPLKRKTLLVAFGIAVTAGMSARPVYEAAQDFVAQPPGFHIPLPVYAY